MDVLEPIFEEFDLGPAPTPARVTVQATELSHADALAAAREFDGHGWACTTDSVHDDVRGAELGGDDKMLLWAELCRRDGRSLHLRHVGDDRWAAHEIVVAPGEGEDLIVSHRLARIGGGALLYEVAWRRDDEGIYRPWASRFAGLEE